MSLLRNYNNLGAQKLKDFTDGVIGGLGNAFFSTLAAAVVILKTLNTTLGNSILPRNQSTKTTDDIMAVNMAAVVKKLDELRPLADALCDGDEVMEQLSGFTPSKRGRTTRKSIAAVVLVSAKPTGVAGQLLIKLEATIPGNRGYEVHCVHGGNDIILGVFYVRGRSKEILATGFPSLVKVDVYLITLSTNNLRSLPSNTLKDVAAS